MNVSGRFTRSDFHAYIFPVLAAMVTYHNHLDRNKQVMSNIYGKPGFDDYDKYKNRKNLVSPVLAHGSISINPAIFE